MPLAVPEDIDTPEKVCTETQSYAHLFISQFAMGLLNFVVAGNSC